MTNEEAARLIDECAEDFALLAQQLDYSERMALKHAPLPDRTDRR